MINVIARAFELACSGTCGNISEIRRKLTQEGYDSVPSHLSGQMIRKQLRDEIRMATERAPRL